MTAIAACELRNPSIEPTPLPTPLGGVLSPGQIVVLPISAAALLTLVPNIQEALNVTDLPNYGGPVDSSYLNGLTRQLIPFSIASSVAVSLSTSSAVVGNATSNLLNAVFARPGFVTALSAELEGTNTGTSILEIDVYDNAAAFAADVNGNLPQLKMPATSKKGEATFTPGSFAFAAGDELSVRLTTSSGWTNTGSPLLGFLEVMC